MLDAKVLDVDLMRKVNELIDDYGEFVVEAYKCNATGSTIAETDAHKSAHETRVKLIGMFQALYQLTEELSVKRLSELRKEQSPKENREYNPTTGMYKDKHFCGEEPNCSVCGPKTKPSEIEELRNDLAYLKRDLFELRRISNARAVKELQEGLKNKALKPCQFRVDIEERKGHSSVLICGEPTLSDYYPALCPEHEKQLRAVQENFQEFKNRCGITEESK